MAKYLFQGSYIGEGLKGLLREGGTSRIDAANKLFGSLGGTLECFYFAFGAAHHDFSEQVILVRTPDVRSVSGDAISFAFPFTDEPTEPFEVIGWRGVNDCAFANAMGK